jgi:hypothetical protein
LDIIHHDGLSGNNRLRDQNGNAIVKPPEIGTIMRIKTLSDVFVYSGVTINRCGNRK